MNSAAHITLFLVLVMAVTSVTSSDRREAASKLSAMVKLMKLEDCAARVVCDLSCRPDFYGGEGKRVLRTLVKIQTSGQIDRDDMRFYLNAGMTGRRARVVKECDRCEESYKHCVATASDLVEVMSLIRVDF